MINIGIVGAGGMGTVHHSNYLHLDGCAVTGVVDPSPAGRERAAQWGVPCYESITDMVEAGGVDVVDICTPTFLHRDNVMESLSLGKTTIVEKPCALTRADAEAMFALAEEKGVNLYVAQVLQFTREVEVLRKLVREGTYGRPLDAVFQRLSARPEWAQGGWLFDKSKSGLVPFDLHIHDLDVIVSLFGVPDRAECRPCGGPAMDSPELYRWEYRCGGVNVMAEAGWLNASIPFTAVWRVYFENAMVIYDGNIVTAYPHGSEPVVFDTEEAVKIPTGINVPPTGWYYAELGHFLSCIREGKPSPLVPRERILAVLDLLETALEADGADIPVNGVFILREAVAPGDLLPGLTLEKGAIQVDRSMATSVPGVFAAGDATGAPLQVSKAVGEGLIAALSACEYLDRNGSK